MVRLIGLRPVWLPKGTLSNIAQTIMIHFFMVISPRRFIWSNHLVLLLRESLVWYANYVVPYMV